MQLYTSGMLIAERYHITRLLGSGGMSAVYEAQDTFHDLPVALKQNGLPQRRAAWSKAAHQLVGLDHPNLPRVERVLDTHGSQFLVTEYFSGSDLEELLNGGFAPTTADVLVWADQLLCALAYLHQRRPAILHGAIRPRHLKLTARGRPMLIDQRVLHVDAKTVEARRADPYIPPETLRGGRIDARSDMYALAASLYYLLTSIPPIDAATRRDLTASGAGDPLPPVDQVNAEVSPHVGVALCAGMALDPRDRPQTAMQFQALLRHARDGHAPTLPAARPAREGRWRRWLGVSH
jgi:serine/threonine protein kinase